MPRSVEEKAVTEEFATCYRLGAADIMRRIERSVCGCDYGSTSWTTRADAERFAGLLELRPGSRVVDLGAGSGWPALYLARMTGCAVVMVDLPLSGLMIASDRAFADRLADRCFAVSAEAEALPFRDASFDAVCHSDVLCCLEAKRAVLRSCRRVVPTGGRMAFTVISHPPGVTAADIAVLDGAGPPFVGAEAPYPDMLAEEGWEPVLEEDWSAGYAESLRRLIAALEDQAEAVCALLGRAVWDDKLAIQRRALAGVESGILRRHLHVAVAASSQG